MTHLFYIHSALTEKIARKIAGTMDETCVGISQKRYETEWTHSSADDIYDLKPFRYQVFKNWGRIWEGDRTVSVLTDGPFQLYAPQTAIESVRLLLSHRRCVGFSLMEEGLMSYCTRKQMNTVVPSKGESLLRKIGYLGRLGPRTFCRDNYDDLYVIREEAFPDRTEKTVVPVHFGQEQPTYDFDDEDCILVLESLRFYDKKSCSVYLASIAEVLKEIKRRYKRVYYKLHPDSYGNWPGTVLASLIDRFGPPATEIARAENLEDIAIEAGIDVVLNISSTGLYCGLFSDGTVYTFHELFSARYPDEEVVDGKVAGVSDWIPEIFWRNTESFMGTA